MKCPNYWRSSIPIKGGALHTCTTIWFGTPVLVSAWTGARQEDDYKEFVIKRNDRATVTRIHQKSQLLEVPPQFLASKEVFDKNVIESLPKLLGFTSPRTTRVSSGVKA